MEARKYVVHKRLFPLKGKMPAAIVKWGIEESDIFDSDEEFVKMRFADNSDDYAYYFDCNVEHNGYYLIKAFVKAEKEVDGNSYGRAATVALNNGILHQGIGAERMLLDPFLKTDILTVVHVSKKQYQLCAVNAQANQIYLYTVDVGSTGIQGLFSRKKHTPKLRLVPHNNPEKTVGACVFNSKDKRIAGIAASPAFNNHILTIAFDDGEIIVGKIQNQQFQQIKQLKEPSSECGEVTLLASDDGCVVAYYSATQKIHLWFLNQKKDHADFYLKKYPNGEMPSYAMYDKAHLRNISISPDGDYVYGLEVQSNGKHQTVQCYSLRELNGVHRVKFTDAIADFAIGENGQVAVIHEDADCEGKNGLPNMIKLVNIKRLLQRKVDAIDLNQLWLDEGRSLRK